MSLDDLLGVSPDADDAELKKAYRKQAMQHHPDKNPDDPDAAHSKFQDIQNAYEILTNPNDRASYDAHGPDFNDRRHPSGPSADDFFASMFGGGGGGGYGGGYGSYSQTSGRPPRPKRGQDTLVRYDVTLEDLYNGKKVVMGLERQGICGHCEGTGGKKNAKPRQCVKCMGKGRISVNRMISGRMMATSQAVCPLCNGEGTKIRDVDQCRKCKGEKTIKEKKKAVWHIEKGMRDGSRIVLSEHGDQYPGQQTPDIVFILRLVPHPTFKLAEPASSGDLLTTITLTLSESLTGFSRIVLTHLDGRGITLTVPRGKVVNHGDTLKISGEGMWQEGARRKGDLWVRCELEKIGEDWLKSVDLEALAKLLPPKRGDPVPMPEIVEEASYTLAKNAPKPRPTTNDYGEDQYDDNEPEYGAGYADSGPSGFFDEEEAGMPPQCAQQ